MMFGNNSPNIKHSLGCVLVVLALLLLLAVPVSAADSGGRLTAVVLANYPPLYVINSSGRPDGYGVEVFRKACEYQGLDYEFITVKSWSDAIEALRSGRADVIPGIPFDPRFEKEFDFLNVFGTIPVTIFVRAESMLIHGDEDLPGRRVGVVGGRPVAHMLESIENIQLVRYEDVINLVRGLVTGKVDAVVCPELMFRIKARILGVADRVKEVGEPVSELKRGYLVRKDSLHLDKLQHGLEIFLATPDFAKLYLKWWKMPEPFWTMEKVFLTSAGILVMTAVLLVFWRYLSVAALNRGLEETRLKLEASQARLNRAQEIALVGSFEVEIETGKGFCSDGFYKLLGLPVVKALPKKQDILGMIHPDDIGRYRPDVKGFSPDQPEYDMEFRLKPKDSDEYRDILCRLFYEFDENGKAVKRAGTFQDITDRKRIEAELKSAIQAAETASQAKSEFLANMSHELRTPLNGTMGMLQLLALDDLSSQHREYVETALSACKGLTQLLGDILDLSKVEAGRMELYNQDFALSEVLSGVDETFRYLARDKNLRLECVVAPDVPRFLEGDPARLRQILFNLVGNALKFTDEGSVLVEVSALRNKTPGRCRLLFSVADTGIGIPDEKINSIFGAFTQVDGARTRKYQGTGLGLNIVKRLAELMGGDICISSEVSKGTTIYFAVTLLLGSGEMPELPDIEPGALEVGPKRVLVVEDERTNRIAICRFLQLLGHSVKWVSNGLEALQHVAMSDYDLILMDIQMPILNGIEATKRIRQADNLGPKKNIPIVALTAHAMSGDRENFLEAGMDDYLSKPVDISELKRVLVRIFGKAS